MALTGLIANRRSAPHAGQTGPATGRTAARPKISWRAQWFGLRRLLKLQMAGPLRVLFNVSLFIGIGLSVGLGSARYMTTTGSQLTTQTVGSWSTWNDLGRPSADPYTIGFAARQGMLPVASTHTRYYFANRDSNGSHLVTTCTYAVEGKGPDSQWWSLGAFTDDGRLIANPSGRYGVSSSTILRGSDGGFRIVISRNARPGNWLPVGPEDSLTLLMQVMVPRDDNVERAQRLITQLPVINRIGCR